MICPQNTTVDMDGVSSFVVLQKVEASFQSATMMEVQVEGGMMTQHLAHRTPPRVPPKPTSKSPPSFVSKVMGARQQSPSPVRHVKGPSPAPVRYRCFSRTLASMLSDSGVGAMTSSVFGLCRQEVSSSTRLSVSPIRPVKSPVMSKKQVRR